MSLLQLPPPHHTHTLSFSISPSFLHSPPPPNTHSLSFSSPPLSPSSSLSFPPSPVYDDTLLHQQLEPPTINGRQSTKENVDKKVVHRRMSLPDSEANGDTEGTGSNEGDRRASTGDFNVPIITSSVSPGLDSVIEGV